MAIKYTAVELWEVKGILLNRGYRFNGTRQYGLQLTKAHPTKRFSLTGQPYREILGGVSHQQLKQILMRSNSAGEAADQIEAISTGAQLAPAFDDNTAVPKVDDKLIERIVQNRTENVIAQKTAAQEQQIALLQQQIEELRQQKAAPAVPAKRKPGRPKGSKNKPKAGDVVLTEEQEEMLDSINFGPQE